MKAIILACCICCVTTAMAQKTNIGVFENNADVGNPAIKDLTVYDKE